MLPDFWHMGRKVVQELRSNATNASIECGHDVTFREFVLYNFRHVNGTWPGVVLNEHFKPIVYNCNPCKHEFDVVGKAETFTSDTELLFASSGLLRTIPVNKQADHVMTEVKDLVEYNLDIMNKLSIHGNIAKKCLSFGIIAERLWTVFQYNGYLGSEVTIPEQFIRDDRKATKKKITKFARQLVDVISQARANTDRKTLATWKKQRVESMRKAYISLSDIELRAFQKTYATDFTLFQYDKVPSWLRSS